MTHETRMVTVYMTQEEFDKIKTNASWDGFVRVDEYLKAKGLGFVKRGC